MKKKVLKSFDDLPKAFSNNDDQSRKIPQYFGDEKHQKYSKGVYSSDLKKRFFEKIPEVDQQYSRKGYDLIIASGVDPNKYSTSQSFGLLLEKNKKEILETLNISPKTKKSGLVKEKELNDYVENKSDYNQIKDFLNNINNLLKQAFEYRTKTDYTRGYLHLLEASNGSFTNGFYKALVSSVNKKGVVVSLFKKGEKLFIPQKNLLQKDVYLRGDEIVVYIEKKDQSFSLLEVDKNLFQIQKRNLFNKFVYYMPKHGKKPIKGKIVGIGEDVNRREIIFVPEEGVQFTLNINTFLDGMKRATEYAQQNFQKNNPVIYKKYSGSRMVWDGKQKYSGKISGRDGENVQYKTETF